MAEEKKLTEKQKKAIRLLDDLCYELNRIEKNMKRTGDYSIGFDDLETWKGKAIKSISRCIRSDEGKNLKETNVEYYESDKWVIETALMYRYFLSKLKKRIEDQSDDFLNDIEEETKKNEDKNFVFISHAKKDKDFAQFLKLELKKADIDVWMAVDELGSGDVWRQEIDDAIWESSALILVMSPDAKKSEYVTYEWAFAFGAKVKVFPIKLKDVKWHPRFESIQYEDFSNPYKMPWDNFIKKLKSNEKQTQGSKKQKG